MSGSKFSQLAVTDEGVYATQDDYGTTYYFRGAVTNNYVKFAGYYWRIVRINGDGSIRLIYDGTRAHANGEKSNDRQIGRNSYNLTYGDNAYFGYMMGMDNQCTSGNCEGSIKTTSYDQATSNTYSSTIKTYIDGWYKVNILDKGYGDKVSDTIYCNDRSMKSGAGYGTVTTYYKANERIIMGNNPVLTCTNQNDRFTVDDTSKGNGALTYPVGLITADEVVMAGSKGQNNVDIVNHAYYLYMGYDYWTMTPADFLSSHAYTYHVYIDGGLYHLNIEYSRGVRPVLSLKSSVLLHGKGTMEYPYTVVS